MESLILAVVGSQCALIVLQLIDYFRFTEKIRVINNRIDGIIELLDEMDK